MDANAAASSHVRATTRKPSRTPTRAAAPAVARSSTSPSPVVTAPATMKGSGVSPYHSANGIGNTAASPRYFASVPTRLTTAGTSMANRRGGPIRATGWLNSECLDDPGRVGGLGEDDHSVAGLEDIVPVGEDRLPVADDRADQRPVHRHVAERHADVTARLPRRHVEDLVAVVFEHRNLLHPRVVGEAHDLLCRDATGVDRYVDSRLLEGGDRDCLVRNRDRELDAVHLSERRCVLVLGVVPHREDAGLRLADPLSLEEVRIEPRCVVDARLREGLGCAARLLARRVDHANADSLLEQHACNRRTHATGPEDH